MANVHIPGYMQAADTGAEMSDPKCSKCGRLFAAAPELLAACKAAIPLIDTQLFRATAHAAADPEVRGLALLRAAIAKAEPQPEEVTG